jgi:hypothetical protein
MEVLQKHCRRQFETVISAFPNPTQKDEAALFTCIDKADPKLGPSSSAFNPFLKISLLIAESRQETRGRIQGDGRGVHQERRTLGSGKEGREKKKREQNNSLPLEEF